jgi:hypothetical protein
MNKLLIILLLALLIIGILLILKKKKPSPPSPVPEPPSPEPLPPIPPMPQIYQESGRYAIERPSNYSHRWIAGAKQLSDNLFLELDTNQADKQLPIAYDKELGTIAIQTDTGVYYKYSNPEGDVMLLYKVNDTTSPYPEGITGWKFAYDTDYGTWSLIDRYGKKHMEYLMNKI